jgi:methylglutaconyl-CoA hydratase
MMNPVLSHIDARGVARVTLNRPEVHNALNAPLIRALTENFIRLGEDDTVRLVVLTGAGKSFCAGADLEDMKASGQKTTSENEADARALAHLFEAINFCPKPVLMQAKGAVMGGGVGLISCADYVIADAATKFCLSEVRLGLIPAVISPFVLAKVGQSHARALFLSAERFDVARALNIGLIHQYTDEIESAVDALIAQMLENGPKAQTAAKALIFEVDKKPIDFHLTTLTSQRIAAIRASDEGVEGLSAFLEKRKPRWGQ